MNSIGKAFMLSGAVMFGLGVNPVSAQHDHGAHGHGAHGHGAKMHGEKAGHSHEHAEAHGGSVTMSKEFHVETVFMPDEVRLYLYDGDQNPIHVKHWKSGLVEATGVVEYRDRSRGSTVLKFMRGTPVGYECPMCAGQESSKPGKCGMCGMNLVKKDVPDGTLWSCPMHPDENGKGPGTCDDCGMKYTPQDYLMAMADFSGLKAGEARATFTLNNLPASGEKTLKFTEKFVPAGSDDDHADHDHGDHDHGH